ncbi:hypothetical protein OG555_19305 [Kribbella sp. NBC_01484]|uniref:hypothetical protein n=1 Tax=Kribbella sp. NBC_01484 TaxID=2903579 RepID=UPI002E323BA8|nr:hypothetical protein [Kribbella sp. NBC_01484]
MSGWTPYPARPRTIRRTTVDFPRPGLPRMVADGLRISLARMNQLIGSQQIVASFLRLRPSGTPIMGAPLPTGNGHSPHTWIEVPRHRGGGCR